MTQRIAFILLSLIFLFNLALGQELSYCINNSIGSIGPIYGEEKTNSSRITSLIFPRPIITNANFDVIPILFEEIPEGILQEDGKVRYEFSIKPNIFWDDGESLTAEDFVFTLNVINNPEVEVHNAKEKAEPIVNMIAVDNSRLDVIFNQMGKDNLGALTFGILPRHKFIDDNLKPITNLQPSNNFFSRNPVGFGVFKVDRMRSDYIQMVRNENYFDVDNSVNFERFLAEQRDEVAVIVDQFLSSVETNFLPDVPVTRISDIVSSPEHHHVYYHEFSWQFMGFNLRLPIFQDLNLRKAINLAINKTDLNDDIYHGEAQVISGPFPPHTSAYNQSYIEAGMMDLGRSPIVQAKELLLDSGYIDSNGDGFIEKDGEKISFTFTYRKGNSEDNNLATSLMNTFGEIGIDLIPNPVEEDVFTKKVYEERDFEITLATFSFGTDPSVYNIFHSSLDRVFGFNICGLRNPEIDTKLEEASSKADRETRFYIYRQLHQMIADQYPGVFLWKKPNYVGYHFSLKGINSDTVDSQNIFKYISKWYME